MVLDSSTSDADETYDAVHRATRDAVWYVVGTVTLMLFHLALAAICLSIAYAGIDQFLSDSRSVTLGVVTAGAIAVGLFSVYRVFSLVTE
ncbi:hypothetical protein [Halopelagius longus]|uniref:Uncharacterized protein n=1 Tax=Halopelagius longus TaxID=1236180 RepID=A0A1H1ECP3_9EURY|nr:hypothetical protein [Halopelagius longus]RDI71682.1 hypothetical protein DWB78_08050 [Halopelagius longus]SDQ85926.1 hypothetical protein SAMN05216278_2820 [Halopelagius longus]